MYNLPKVLTCLGLNETQVSAYLYILKHKEANLTTIAQALNLSLPGATKMLTEMIDRGFVKKFRVKTKKFYLLADLDIFQSQILKRKKAEINEINEAFEEIKSSYGFYPIKITRIASDVLVETMKTMICKCKEAFEFVDRRFMVKNDEKNFNINNVYKDVKFNTIYFDPDNTYSCAKKIEIDITKKYAQILSFDDKISFITTKKDAILLENDEIANSIQALINHIKNEKSTTNNIDSTVI